MLGVVCDSVENIRLRANVAGRKQVREVNRAEQVTVGRIDANDPIRLPEIRVDFPVYIFEFVEIFNRAGGIVDRDCALNGKVRGIDETDLIASVAHDQRSAVGSQTPAFALVVELADPLKVVPIVNEANVVLPGELKNFRSEESDPFTEIFFRNFNLMDHFAGFHLDLTQGRSPVQTRAFQEVSVIENQPLSEGVHIVGIGMNYPVTVSRGRVFRPRD